MIEWDSQPYELKSRMVIIDPDDVRIFKKLLSQKPHRSVDYLWNDIGLGNLFAE
jgi:hypothetical protein